MTPLAPVLANTGGDAMAVEYRYADFTRANYRRLVALAATHYTFVRYSDDAPVPRTVLWRHDVDLSVQGALALARIEADLGVRATYFLRLHAEMYNLLDVSTTTVVRAIRDLGHDVGLHFEPQWHGVTHEAQLDDAIAHDAAILERVIGVGTRAFSFHDPSEFLLSCQQPTYGGKLNTYAARYQRDVAYVSDSNGYWRHRRLEDVLATPDDRALQVLTHPEWWTPQACSPAARIERCIAGRAEAMRAHYRTALARAGRANVGA